MEPLAQPLHRRKLSSVNGVFSFSSKNAYEDVIAAVPPAAAKLKPPARVEEYEEIFGGGSRGRSSIPVLDLSTLDGERNSGPGDHRSGSKKQMLDYTKIFGGFRDEDIAMPYEELVAQKKSRKASSDKAAMKQPDKEFLLRSSENCRLSGKNKGLSSEASDQSSDGVKQVNMSYHRSSPRSKDGTSGTTHIAKLQAVPGFTYFIDETARQQKTEEGDRPVPKIKSEPQRTWSFSGNIPEETNCRKAEVPMLSKLPPEGVFQGKRGSLWDGPRSNAKLFYSGEINPKSNSFKSSRSSSPPAKLNDSNGHPKQSKSSNFASKANASEKTSEYTNGSSDEELDMNSAAAASAAALKKAIEQAQESIRLAKQLMERKKDGFQGYSKPSSKGKNRKESRSGHEGKPIKENNSKVTFEKIDDVLQGFARRNRKTALRSDEVTTTVEHSGKPSASRKVEVEINQIDVVRADAESASLLDLGTHVNNKTTTLASAQMANKITTMNKKACNFDEMKSSEETSECKKMHAEKTKAVERDIASENAESRTNVQQAGIESKVTVNKSVFAFKLPEYDVSDNLKITQEDIGSEDMRDGFDEWQECEKEFEECLDLTEEEKPVPPRVSDYMCKESQKMAEERKPKDTSQQERMEPEPVDVSVKDEESETRLGSSSNGAGGLVQEGACEFVEMDDKPIEVLSIRSCRKTEKEIQEGEVNVTSDLIHERDIAKVVPNHEYNAEETHRILDRELKEKEDEELDVKEIEPINSRDGNKMEKLLIEEEREGKEVQLRCEEAQNCLEADQNMPEEVFELGEVEKRTEDGHVNEATERLRIEAYREAQNQKLEVMQEAEEAEVMQVVDESKSVHLEAHSFGDNHEIGFIQKASCDQNSKTEVQTAGRVEVSNENVEACPDAVEKHVDTCSTRVANDACYHQRERYVEEVGIKEASELEDTEISEGGHFVHSAYQEHDIPSNTQDNNKTTESDGSGANIHYNEINDVDKFSAGNTSEENDVDIQPESSEAHLFDEKSAYTASSSENSKRKEIEEIVGEGFSSNPEIVGGLVHEDGKNVKTVEEADDDVFDKEEKQDEIEVDNNQRSTEDDYKEAKSTFVLDGQSSNQVALETYQEMGKVNNMPPAEEHLNKTGTTKREMDNKGKDVKEKYDSRKVEPDKKDRDRNIDRIAVERAIREARERAFLEARERAERAAVERAAAEVRQRQMAEARGRIEKATGGNKIADKASMEAKMRAERAAVLRATAEARERALEKALSQKSSTEARAEKLSGVSRDNELQHSFSSSDLEASTESAQRRKARLERHQRIMERAAKALEEKNMRDLQAQKEQAERNRLAETLDADIKRWASGKEGNLRALISTLQYILGPDSGWQPISLTEIITTAAVKKTYRKATLYVHPDKLQQRGASIHQKYICEKVFDLLKAAWNRFNSEER